MKKILLSFVFAVIGLPLFAAQNILLGDTSDPERALITSIGVTNGAVITSTNCIASSAIIGATNTTGAGSAGLVVKLNDSGQINTNMLSAAFTTPFTSSFTSTNIVITSAGIVTNAHGLGGTPTMFQARLINTSTDKNYSLNDEVVVPVGATDGSLNIGVAVVPDASNLVMRFGQNPGASFVVLDKTSGSVGVIDNTKWVLVIRAWK
jgi:hypothetical protein